jgi:hypothetical protein
LDQQHGVLKLQPTYVRRFYMDGGRLRGGKPGATYNRREGMWKPERWIASGTVAVNPKPVPGEGLSFLSGAKVSFPEALAAVGQRMLGRERFQAHGPEFRVLIKILDGHTPIVFHFHADDKAVANSPKHFAGHRFGKDEAYYFLQRPKGRCPYTHVGLHPGTSPEDLRDAVARGSEVTLELSPSFLQRFEEGFFVPAGVVHRPGSALTLEIQQPSDVYTLLEDHMDDVKFSPAQIHPGFRSLGEALRFVDFKTSTAKDILDRYRLVPRSSLKKKIRGVSEDWIFPPQVCKKFSGKRLRVNTKTTTIESECYAVLVWKGKGKVGPHRVQSGDEFFVTHEAARKGINIESQGADYLELFKFFAAPI